MNILNPITAFLIYLVFAAVLSGIGKGMAGQTRASEIKSSLYASGEAPEKISGAPGYQPFFVTALFFAILHLGILVLGSGGLTPVAGAYLVGLLLALLVVIFK